MMAGHNNTNIANSSKKIFIPVALFLCSIIILATYSGTDSLKQYDSKSNLKAEDGFKHSLLKYPDILEYFEIDNHHAWQVTFDHAVNSLDCLEKATKNGNIHMIEADILLGSVPNVQDLHPNTNIPIMASPPDVTSDIDFKTWLTIAMAEGKKGLKFHMHSLNVVLPALLTLKQVSLHILDRGGNLPPVWLNADVIDGPNNKSALIHGSEFLRVCSELMPFASLSLGWGNDPTIQYPMDASITKKMVEDMFSLCGKLRQPVTFFVRFSLVKNSWSQLQWLLDQKPNQFSVTIYNCKMDDISERELNEIRKLLKGYTVFYDLSIDSTNRFELFGSEPIP